MWSLVGAKIGSGFVVQVSSRRPRAFCWESRSPPQFHRPSDRRGRLKAGTSGAANVRRSVGAADAVGMIVDVAGVEDRPQQRRRTFVGDVLEHGRAGFPAIAMLIDSREILQTAHRQGGQLGRRHRVRRRRDGEDLAANDVNLQELPQGSGADQRPGGRLSLPGLTGTILGRVNAINLKNARFEEEARQSHC